MWQCTLEETLIFFKFLGLENIVILRVMMVCLSTFWAVAWQAVDSEHFTVLYIEYLSMARAGLLALEQWDPKSKVYLLPSLKILSANIRAKEMGPSTHASPLFDSQMFPRSRGQFRNNFVYYSGP